MKKPHQYGDAPIEASITDKMVAIMKTLDEFLNDGATGKDRKLAIAVLIFPFGETPGRCNYMSNGIDRRDMETLLYEQAERFRAQRVDQQLKLDSEQ
jgi:hypothetical protein